MPGARSRRQARREVRLRLIDAWTANSSAPPGRIRMKSDLPTGSAVLHPWLQSTAPPGPDCRLCALPLTHDVPPEPDLQLSGAKREFGRRSECLSLPHSGRRNLSRRQPELRDGMCRTRRLCRHSAVGQRTLHWHPGPCPEDPACRELLPRPGEASELWEVDMSDGRQQILTCLLYTSPSPRD